MDSDKGAGRTGQGGCLGVLAACPPSGLLPRVPSRLPKYGPPYPPSSRISSPVRPPMDDLAHESRPIHSLNRKRKADQDDHNVPPSPSDPPSTPDAMLIDPQATPRCPADAPTSGPSTSSWHIARSSQGMAPSWPQPPCPSCAPSAFNPRRLREGQPSPKRLRLEIPCPPPGSPHRSRRSRGPTSRHHHGRHRRAGETRDTGIVSATEPGPSRGSLLRSASLPSLSSSSRSVPASPIEPITISPHIPSHQPPINRETLKELDLEAILRNPQLRQYPFLFLLTVASIVFTPMYTCLCRP